jgi:hypothetical protein
VKVIVQPLIDTRISKLISSFVGVDKSALEMFDYCQTLGEVYTGFIDGEFVCCWGLIPPSFLSTQAYLWMWAPEPMKYQFTFIRHSQLQVEAMLQYFETIVGDCVIGNRSAQRWLRWLGAEFEAPIGNRLPFVIRRKYGPD